MKKNQRGFTLVELSIVLVIIGLLIGGILAARSMVQTTKVQNVISQLTQIEISVSNFRMNFKTIPGDSNQFTPPGDNDGIYEDLGACLAAPNDIYSGNESVQAWGQLKISGMIKPNYEAYSPAACGGPHTNSFDDLLTVEKTGPYIELSGNAARYQGKRYPMTLGRDSTSAPLFVFFYADPLDVLALETKMGSVDTVNKSGLYNTYNAPGNCYNHIEDEYYGCGEPEAHYGRLRYNLPTN